MELKYLQHDALLQRWANYSLQPFCTFLKSCKNNNKEYGTEYVSLRLKIFTICPLTEKVANSHSTS